MPVDLHQDAAVGAHGEAGADRVLRLRRADRDQHDLGRLAGFLQAQRLLDRDLVERVHRHLGVREIDAGAVGLHPRLDVRVDHPLHGHEHLHGVPQDFAARGTRRRGTAYQAGGRRSDAAFGPRSAILARNPEHVAVALEVHVAAGDEEEVGEAVHVDERRAGRPGPALRARASPSAARRGGRWCGRDAAPRRRGCRPAARRSGAAPVRCSARRCRARSARPATVTMRSGSKSFGLPSSGVASSAPRSKRSFWIAASMRIERGEIRRELAARQARPRRSSRRRCRRPRSGDRPSAGARRCRARSCRRRRSSCRSCSG